MFDGNDYEKEKLRKLDYIQEDLWKLQDIERKKIQTGHSSETQEIEMTEEERLESDLFFLQPRKKLDIFLIIVTCGGWLLFMFIRKKRRDRILKKLAIIRAEN